MYDCDYYNTQFEEQLVKYTDSFLAAGNDSCRNTKSKESDGNEPRADDYQKSRGDENEK